MSSFMWYDLMTTDTAAAAEFYGTVVGWTAQDQGNGMGYSVLSVGKTGIGGLMALPEAMRAGGAKPSWLGYVGVNDVDAEAARLQKAGGTLHRPPEDVPGIVRFAVVSDPQGAGFMLLKGLSDQPFERLAPGTPGTVGWHELHAADGASAFAFYAEMFGWQKADAMDMGPMGVYQLFTDGAEPIGGMMTKNAAIPQPFWLFYICIDDIDAALGRVTGKGGQVMNGPMQVPGGSWVAQCVDPQGAMFALVGPKLAQD
jgi:uncharacterized protein